MAGLAGYKGELLEGFYVEDEAGVMGLFSAENALLHFNIGRMILGGQRGWNHHHLNKGDAKCEDGQYKIDRSQTGFLVG